MHKIIGAAAAAVVSVVIAGADPAFADDENNCSDFCNVGGDTIRGEGTAVGPAQGFHFTIPGYVPGVERVTNVGNSNAGHIDVEFSDGSGGTLSGAWVEQLGVVAGHATGGFGDCSGLDC